MEHLLLSLRDALSNIETQSSPDPENAVHEIDTEMRNSEDPYTWKRRQLDRTGKSIRIQIQSTQRKLAQALQKQGRDL